MPWLLIDTLGVKMMKCGRLVVCFSAKDSVFLWVLLSYKHYNSIFITFVMFLYMYVVTWFIKKCTSNPFSTHNSKMDKQTSKLLLLLLYSNKIYIHTFITEILKACCLPANILKEIWIIGLSVPLFHWLIIILTFSMYQMEELAFF